MTRLHAVLLLIPLSAACTTRDDDYLLLRRPTTKPGEPTAALELAPRTDAEAYYLRHLLASGFGAELLRTYAMTKRFAARTGGRRETDTMIALGAPDHPALGAPARRVKIGWWRTKLAADAPIIWIDDSGPRRARSTMADLVSGFGGAILDVVAPETGAPYSKSSALRDGYIDFLQVVAAEWRPPSDTDDRDDLRQLSVFADVRGNGAVRRLDDSPHAMIADPAVVATVFYRLAASDLGRRMAEPAVYKPFLEAQPPRDIHPALLLGAFRNFQAKLIAAWTRAQAAGRPPHDLIDLVEAYGDAYPAERAEATRIFLVTTYGATALPGAVRADEAPEQIEIQLAALTADVLFGRRGLRDGFARAR
ncbi:MAG TPA: hypothetical protein VKQ32_18745 [Polyangia bacterium]|nr:hypothetical protein [Polyangia bacterium]